VVKARRELLPLNHLKNGLVFELFQQRIPQIVQEQPSTRSCMRGRRYHAPGVIWSFFNLGLTPAGAFDAIEKWIGGKGRSQ